MRIAARLCGLILLVLIAWSVLWFYAAHEARGALDAFVADERSQGRDWRCPDRSVGGYPFAIRVDCRDASFAGQSFGSRVLGRVAHVSGGVSLLHPRTVALVLEAPFSYASSDGQTDVVGSWSRLGVDLTGWQGVRSLRMRGAALAVKGRFGQAGEGAGRVATFDATFGEASGGADPVVGFALAVNGIDMPALDALFRNEEPVDLTLNGTLDHADVTGAQTPEAALEIWRRSGGHVDLSPSRMVRGKARLVASGSLSLGPEHRLQGRLDADFYGLGPVLARYGIGGNVVAAGSLLTALFGSGGRKAPPAGAGALSLPIVFSNGRLGIGPVRTDVVLAPLY